MKPYPREPVERIKVRFPVTVTVLVLVPVTIKVTVTAGLIESWGVMSWSHEVLVPVTIKVKVTVRRGHLLTPYPM